MTKVDLDTENSLYRDIIQDNINNSKFKNKLIFVLVFALVGVIVYYEWNFKKFISQYDFESTIEAVQDGSGVNVIGKGNNVNEPNT